MNTCCNQDVFYEEDLRRWEVGCSVPYYTKAEIDKKLENIDISGDCISSGDVQNMIDASVEPIEGSVEALSGTVGELSTDMENKADRSEIPSLSGYATQQWVNDKGYLTSRYLKGIKETSGSNTISLAKTSTRTENIVFGGDVDAKIEYRNSNEILMRCLLPIKGASNSIETIDSYPFESVNGLVATRYNYAIGQWNERDDYWEGSENYFSIGDGTSDSNRHNIFTILRDGSIKLSDGRFLQEWMDDIDNNYATQVWVNNQGYLTEHQPLKTINGQSLIGSGNITISGGGSADLSNYYTIAETDYLLNDLSQRKLDVTAYTPTDLSQYWTSAQTQSAIDAATQGKADASNVYNKSEINSIINNKFWCGTQTQYEALATKDPNILYLIHE